MNRKQKEDLVAQISNELKDAQAVMITDFQGLKVEEMSGLRRKLGLAGAKYQVAKNTLIKLAVKDTNAECITDFLAGNSALGYTSNDPAALAKALVDFAKDKEKLKIKGGVLGGKPLNFDQIKAIADLPSREILLGKVFGTMNAVPTSFVRVLAAVPQKLVYALAAIKDQKEPAA